MDFLSGICRRMGGLKPPTNPGAHSPVAMQNRCRVQVVGPDGSVKQTAEAVANILTTHGLNRLTELLATGGEASNWCSAGAIGTSTTAAASTQAALQASTAIVHMSATNMDASDLGDMTCRYLMTFASNNPAGAAQINEVGIFGTNAASTNMLARIVLGTASVNKGASDSINISYDIVAKTAA